jgi:hypothetical protein
MVNERIRLRLCIAFGAILLSTLIISACFITHAESGNEVIDEANYPPTTIVTEVVLKPEDGSLPTPSLVPLPTFTPTPISPQIDSTDEVVEEESTVQQAEATLEATEPPDIEEDSFSQLAYDDLPPFTQWRDWPVLPIVSDTAWQIYQQGLQAGRNPQAVSVFGDCQSVPEVFWGEFDDINYEWADENHELIETVDWYRGSFDRESVTAKDGTTAAAILWEQWIPEDNDTCLFGETPLYCEARLNNPSIVFISVGTHWELRNERYLRKMLDQLIEMGILPVIVTKADQREGSDGWVNEQMVEIAQEYQVPVWNFWAAMQDFENSGLIEGDAMLLTKEALQERRLSGLRALHTIRLQLLHYQENN